MWGPCNTGPVAVESQIVTIHDTAVLEHPEWFSTGFVRVYRVMWNLLARRALHFTTVSEYSKSRLSHILSIPESRIDVIYNGVSDEFAPVSEERTEAVARDYGAGFRGYFVTLCTLEPRKNLSLVLKAWQLAENRLPERTKLLVVGAAGASRIFRTPDEQTHSTDRVIFTGYVPDASLPPLLSGAIATLYPSLFEGFGLPVLEAMACGGTVVTTNRTSLPEVGGDAVIYADAENAAALADLMIRLAESPRMREEYSARALQRAARFGWEESASQMDTLFRRFL